jgi:hypothetical protein
MPPPIRRSDSNVYSNSRSTGIEVNKQRATTGNGSSKSAVKENRVTTSTTRTNEKTSTTTKSKTYDNKKTGTRDAYEYKGKDTKTTDKAKVTPQGTTTLLTTKKQDAKPLYEKGGATLVEGKGKGPGGVDLSGKVTGPSFKVDGEANIQAKGLKGVDINVKLEVEANLIKAEGAAEKEFKFKVNGEDISVKVKLGAEGNVGIDGSINLKVHVGKDGVSVTAGAEGFAGAKGSLSGEITTTINGNQVAKGKIGVTAAAGAMAGAEIEAGLTHFKAKAYAAVGVGVGFDIQGDVNAGNLAREVPGLLTTWDD